MRTVVFDLDGTLADTSGDLIAAANACLRDLGHGDLLDPCRDQAVAVRGARAMLRLGLERAGVPDEAVVDQQYPSLLAYYDSAICEHTYLYDGAMEAVAALSGAGYRVAICTNKPAALAEKLMAALGVRGAFHALVGADTLPVSKPDAAPFWEAVRLAGGSPQMCLLVGDTATDRNTAMAAGVPSVLVLFGPAGADMAALEPHALLAHYRDLPGVVRDLIG